MAEECRIDGTILRFKFKTQSATQLHHNRPNHQTHSNRAHSNLFWIMYVFPPPQYTHTLVQTFQSHYCPQVSSLAKQLLASVNKRVEEDLGKYLDTNDEEVRK